MDYQPSPRDGVVHDMDEGGSPRDGHRTYDFDFDFDMTDDDMILVKNICFKIFETLKPKHENLNMRIVESAMNRSLAKNPSDLFKYCMTVVTGDLKEQKVAVKAKPKPRQTHVMHKAKPTRTELLPDWFHEETEKRSEEDKTTLLDQRKREIEEKLKLFRK
jgi:hypothetical protein